MCQQSMRLGACPDPSNVDKVDTPAVPRAPAHTRGGMGGTEAALTFVAVLEQGEAGPAGALPGLDGRGAHMGADVPGVIERDNDLWMSVGGGGPAMN